MCCILSNAVAIAVVVTGLAAHAALRPGRPALTGGRPGSGTQPGEAAFTCGTYKGNLNEHRQRQALHLRNQREIQQGRKSLTAALEYIYNDVWIVEDDGSLTLSGTNLFDTSLQRRQFANNGGGVYTVSTVPYSFDATVGTLVSPGDDGAVRVPLPFSFPFAGSSFTQLYVSGNGAVAFGGVLNPNGFYDNADFFSPTPKIAPYYMDLDVTAGGSVHYRSEAAQFTVTWDGVFEYGTFHANTFQLVLYPSGNFTVAYSTIASNAPATPTTIIAGFHPGGAPPLEEISLSGDLPHVSAAGAAVYEQYYSFASPLVDEVALFNRFYQQFPDDFFQLVFFTTFAQTMSGFANEVNIKNDVAGIGLGSFDASAQYGSSGALESRCNMSQLDAWTSSNPAARVYGKGNSFLTIMGQEAGHRWGAFVFFDNGGGPSNLILGRSDAHWSYYFDVDHSSLEGGDWENTGGNNYTCPTHIDYYSELDEYLFGLRTPNEVKDSFLISSASNDLPANRSAGTPILGATATGALVPVTVEDIIAVEGARTPFPSVEEHDLRQGFILLVGQGTVLSQADLDKVAGFRAAWETYFEKSCDGRLTCNTSLTSTYQVAVLSGDPRDRYSQQIIPEFTARSLERGFTQHVPDGGHFTFRYLGGPAQGTSEPATLVFTATGYLPDTLVTTATYGTAVDFGVADILMTPADAEVHLPTTLYANHPNPFNPKTTIDYRLAGAGHVTLAIYDAAGHHVRTLIDRTETAGPHAVDFDGRDDRGQPLASGVYLYRLHAGGVTRSRKMVLLK